MLHKLGFRVIYQTGCSQLSTVELWGAVCVAVPQVSILGPLLLSIYINGVPTVVKQSQIHMYADDTLMYCCGTDLSVV